MLSKRLTDASDNLQQYPGTYPAHEIYKAAARFCVLTRARETRQQLYVDHPTSLKLSWKFISVLGTTKHVLHCCVDHAVCLKSELDKPNASNNVKSRSTFRYTPRKELVFVSMIVIRRHVLGK